MQEKKSMMYIVGIYKYWVKTIKNSKNINEIYNIKMQTFYNKFILFSTLKKSNDGYNFICNYCKNKTKVSF